METMTTLEIISATDGNVYQLSNCINMKRIFLVFIYFIFIIISFKSGLNYLTRFQTPPSEKIERLEFCSVDISIKVNI